MATPKNAPYKKLQRAAEAHRKSRGYVLWTSCEFVGKPPFMKKVSVQGTYIRELHGPLTI